MKRKLNVIDLFVGCGGLLEGFETSGHYNLLAAVDWEEAPVKILRNHLASIQDKIDPDNIVMRFDLQRTDDLCNGWNDPNYGCHDGLDALIGTQALDLLIGGPPCQAYSIAGRIRDANGMRDDYRNYLFEAYIRILKRYRPRVFLFENVPGLLSAMPGDGSSRIADEIHRAFAAEEYAVLNDFSHGLVEMEEYGVPQHRRRIILVGVDLKRYGNKAHTAVNAFYDTYLPQQKRPLRSVRDAIADLPPLMPLLDSTSSQSHTKADPPVNGHNPRRHNPRDIRIFRFLAEDIASGRMQFTSTETLKQLYTLLTGHVSNVHKYHVLRWDEPSNLIPAHLFKDGLRHIHPDPQQARTITVREAARLQTFPDNFLFGCSATDAYRMIGNAVPPLFARALADSAYNMMDQENLI